MNNKERDEKFLKSWLKKKINITTSTVVSFLITGAIGGGSAYGVTPGNKAGNGGSVNSVALGKDSTVDNDSVAVGAKAHASQRNSAGVIANGVAVGKEAVAKGSVSVGEGAKGLWNSIAIGSYSKIGETGKTTGQGIAIGSRAGPNEGAWAKGDQSISTESNTVASGDSSVVIGGDDLDKVADTNASYQKKIFDKNGNQIGSTTTENKTLNQLFASLTGRGEILTLQGVNPIDGRTYIKYKGSEAGQGSVALGVKAVSGDIALAIGGGSSTVGVQGGQVNDAVEEGSMVSFGRKGNECQLKNMAPGEISATSTDAINGSQLYSVAKKLGEGWKADAGGNKIGASTATSVKAGNTLIYSAGSNLQVKQTVDTTNGKQTYEYSLNKDLTGLDSVTTKKLRVPGTGGKDTVIDSNGINAGGNKITNVAPGVNGTDAVNKSQLDTATNSLIDKGMKFSADDYDPANANSTISKKLNERLEVVGGADKTKLSDNNIGSIVDNTGKINIKLGKELTGLTSAEFKNAGGDKTVINGNGLIVVPATPTASPISITKDGISVGDKVIKNVRPGAITKTSTDAINGSQLYNLASNTIQLGGDKATTTDKQQLNNAGVIKFNIVGENGITTKAAGDKVTIGVDTNTIGANIKLKYKSNSDATTAQEVKLSDGLNFQDGNFTKASVDTQGKVKYDTVTQAITPTADGKAQVTPGSSPGLATATDVVNAINNTGWKATAGGNVDGAATSTVVKNGQEVEFNAGDNLKVKQIIDSTTGKQTYEYSLAKDLTKLNSAEFTNVAGDKTKITAGTTEYTNAAGGKTVVNSDGITISSPTPGAKDISVTKDGISAGNKVIKNVAAGVNDTDAVNVSQLKDVDNKITNFNTAINKGLNFKGNSEATVNKQLGDTLQIVGEGTKADSEYSGENIKVVEDGGKLVVKMSKEINSNTVTTNTVAVGTLGKDGLITVKDATGKDRVSINGKDGSSATITTVQGVSSRTGPTEVATDRIQYTDKAGTPHQVATLDDGIKYGGDTGGFISKKLNQQVNVVGGITDTNKLSTKDNIGVVSDGSNNLKVRLAKDLDGLESITVRETSGNAAVVRGDGLTITSPSDNTVSLSNDGLDNGGNIIKNVAAGKDGTDAVNVDQLNQAVGNIVNTAGDTIVQVNNKVDKLGERVNKGLAGAAMAGLEFMDIGINQATVAVAVGVQAAPTENTRVNAKVAITPGSRTETIHSLGALYRFNWR